MFNPRRTTRLVRPGEAVPGRLVGAGDGFRALQYVLSGGMVGESHAIMPTELPMARSTVKDVLDIDYPSDVVIVADADPRNTDNALVPLGQPTDIAALPTIFTTNGPLWTLSSIGALPLNTSVQKSYDLAANFAVASSQTSNLVVTPTRIGAGASDLQGLVTTAVVTVKPPRNQTTRASLAGLVGGHEHYRSSTVSQAHTVLLAGNNKVEFISGNSVDAPGSTFVSQKSVQIPSKTGVDYKKVLVDYAGEGGGIPDYYTGPIKVSMTAVINIVSETSLDESIRPNIILNMYYANVDATTGSLIVTAVPITFWGPSQATPNPSINLAWTASERVENPTNVGGPDGYASYCIGYDVFASAYNDVTGFFHPFDESQATFTFEYPSQSPSGNGPASLTIIDGNYNGPIDVTRTTTYYALPNAERARDYRNHMSRPAPSFVGDAVRTALYCIFHASQGIVFVGEREMDEYLDLINSPDRLLKLISVSSMNNDLLMDNVPQIGVNPGMTDTDRLALEDAGMAPLTMGASMATARDRGAPTLKAGLFDFISKGLGSLGTIAKGVTNVACSPGASSLIDGISRLGAGAYGDGRYGSARYGSSYGGDILDAAGRYRSANRDAYPPKFEKVAVEVGKTPHCVESTHETKIDENEVATIGSKSVTFITTEEIKLRREKARKRRYRCSTFKRTEQHEIELASALKELATLYESDTVDLVVGNGKVTLNDSRDLSPASPTSNCPRRRRPLTELSGEDELPCGRSYPILTSGDKKTQPHYRASNLFQKAPSFSVNSKIRVGITPVPAHDSTPAQVKFAAATAGSQARLIAPSSGYEKAAENAGLVTMGKLRSADMDYESIFNDLGDADLALTGEDTDEDESETDLVIDTVEDPAEPPLPDEDPPPEVSLTFEFKEPELSGPTQEQFEKAMKAVAAGYYPTVSSTGAGPFYTAGDLKRLKGITTDEVNPILPGCARFPLVMDGQDGQHVIHIANLVCSTMPLARGGYTSGDNHRETLEVLETSYHPAFNIKNLRVRLDKAFDIRSVDNATSALKQAVARFPNTTRGPLYVSVDLGDTVIPPGHIEGNSYTLALYIAALGLPVGPTITGAIGKDGKLIAIGEINAKTNVFLQDDKLRESRFAPLIYPRDSLEAETYTTIEEFRSADQLANAGMFGNASKTGIVPVMSLPGVLAFFLGGGYESWANNHVTKEQKKIANRYSVGWKAAVQVYRLTVKITKLKERMKMTDAKGKTEKLKEIMGLKKTFEEQYNMAFVLKDPELKQTANENMLKQDELSEYAKKAKLAMKKVTTDMDGGKYYFIQLDGTKIKSFGPPGYTKSQKKEWALKNLQGVTKEVRIKQKNGQEALTRIFIPQIVSGQKSKTKGRKANQEKAKELVAKSDLKNLFNFKS